MQTSDKLEIFSEASLELDSGIPEKDLIRMFPVTYALYRWLIGACHDPGHKNYFRFGARGVTVHERWLESFSAFLEDMGPAPGDKNKNRSH